MSTTDFSKRLVPESCAYSLGPAEIARNTECNICTLAMDADKPVLTHKACRNAFCAEDLLDWMSSAGVEARCPMCREDLGLLRPVIYDPALAMTMLLRNGIPDMRLLVGNKAFSDVPLSTRLVNPGFLSIETPDLASATFHPALIGCGSPEWLSDIRTGIIPADDPKLKKFMRDSRKAAHQAIQTWEMKGILWVERYMVPEWDPHTTLLCPVDPPIEVAFSIDEVREFMSERREVVRSRGDDFFFPPGSWLKRTLATHELQGMLTVRKNVVIDGLLDSALDDHVEWKLWQTNDPNQPLLFAVPVVPYFKDVPEPRSFLDAKGNLVASVSDISQHPDMQADPDLYNLSGVLGREDLELLDNLAEFIAAVRAAKARARANNRGGPFIDDFGPDLLNSAPRRTNNSDSTLIADFDAEEDIFLSTAPRRSPG